MPRESRLLDVTDPNNPKIIGGFDPSDKTTWTSANSTNASGQFAVQVRPNAFTTEGLKNIQIYATDDAGAVGNKVTFSFTYKPAPP